MSALTEGWPHGYEIVIHGEVRKATVLCWDKPKGPGCGYPVVAHCENGSVFTFAGVGDKYGRAGYGGPSLTLRNAPAPKRSGWVNVWTNDEGTVWASGPFWQRHDADAPKSANSTRIACLPFTEGDGLTTPASAKATDGGA